LITTAKSAPASCACLVSSMVSCALCCPVCAMTWHLPRADVTTAATSRRRSVPLSAQNSLITPAQNTPATPSSPVSRSMSARSARMSSSPSLSKGVVVAAHSPRNRSRAAALASCGA
jgi:hypothetical protein